MPCTMPTIKPRQQIPKAVDIEIKRNLERVVILKLVYWRTEERESRRKPNAEAQSSQRGHGILRKRSEEGGTSTTVSEPFDEIEYYDKDCYITRKNCVKPENTEWEIWKEWSCT